LSLAFRDECTEMIDKTGPGLKVAEKFGCGEANTESTSGDVPDYDDEYPQDPTKTPAGK
jgi:hypothetical protein